MADGTSRSVLTREEVVLVQKRLALAGLVGASLTALGVFLSHLRYLVAAERPPLGALFLQLAGGVILIATWLACRRGMRSLRFVRTLDAASFVACNVCFAMMTSRFPAQSRPDLWAALISMQVVVMRAVLVPSSARRTAILSTVASLPLFVVAWYTHRGLDADVDFNHRVPILQLELTALLWVVLDVGLATVTSSVIYGLRREVQRAMELGQYTLLEKIGEGGMGQVFRARHAMLRRPTAVKLLHSASPAELARFEREVQLTAQLTHPNTITVFDYGKTPDGVFYYAMELLEGADLQKLVERDGPMPPARVVHVLAQVAGALAEAHGVGLIHRDIKPANIILCARGAAFDVAKVVDFGLVKSTGVDAEKDLGASNPDAVMGTPLYIAPESIKTPEAVDSRVDIYALGAVGYFLITGTPVFLGTSLGALLADHVHARPVPPSERLGVPVPPDLEALILACLAKSPDDRPAGADALRQRLLACATVGVWTQAQARAAWSAKPIPAGAKDDVVSWSATTMAVDATARALP